MFGTAISAAAATKRGESRQTPRDRRAYPCRGCGRQFIFQLERGLFGKRGNRRFSPSRFCVSRGWWTRKQTGPKSAAACQPLRFEARFEVFMLYSFIQVVSLILLCGSNNTTADSILIPRYYLACVCRARITARRGVVTATLAWHWCLVLPLFLNI